MTTIQTGFVHARRKIPVGSNEYAQKQKNNNFLTTYHLSIALLFKFMMSPHVDFFTLNSIEMAIYVINCQIVVEAYLCSTYYVYGNT